MERHKRDIPAETYTANSALILVAFIKATPEPR